MKKLLVAVTVLMLSTAAMAQHHGHHGHHGHGHWAGPLIGGIILGGIIANSQRPIIVAQPPVVIAQPPVIIGQPPVIVYPFPNYQSCLVQVQDPITGVIRNEVRTCIQ